MHRRYLSVFVSLLLCCAASAALCQVDTWTFRAHMLTPREDLGAATGPDGRIYAIGGFSGGIRLATVEAYDPGTDTWSYVASMSIPRTDFGCVTGPDGKIYAIGGFFSSGSLASAERYDTSTNTWLPIASVPIDTSSQDVFAAAMGNDGKIHAFVRGASSTTYQCTYDIAGNTWSPLSQAPYMPGNPAIAAGADGLIYAAGGFNNMGYGTKNLSIYNAYADAWLAGTDMTTARDYLALARGGDNRIYAIGGGNSLPQISMTTVEAYDPAQDAWTTVAPLQVARFAHAAATGPDGRIYALGGYLFDPTAQIFQSVVLDSVEVYQPALLTASPSSVSAEEGSQFTGTVATFTDANTAQTVGDFTVSVDWGDGATSSGTVTSTGSGAFTVNGSHTYAAAGSYTVTVKITDSDSETATTTGKATISDAPLHGTAASLTPYANVPFSGTVASFTDDNPFATAADFTASILWGDGSASQGTIVTDPSGGFRVTGSHTYTATGYYPLDVTINDVGGANILVSALTNVQTAPPTVTAGAIQAIEGTNFSGVVASFTDADTTLTAGSFTAAIDWGDGHTSTGTVASNGSGGFNVSGANTYAEEGSFVTKVTVSVAGGSTGSANGSAVVADAPLTATGLSIVSKSRSFSGVVATFADADVYASAGDFTATILWGDGSSNPGVVTALGGGGFSVSGSYTYKKKGKYAITVNIKDLGGSVATAHSAINAGSVK